MLLNNYLPDYLTETNTFGAILNSDEIEIDGINNNAQDIVDQAFVATATWGLPFWESFLGIVTDLSKDINYRRTVILSKLRGTGTVTVNMIQNVASSFSNGSVLVTESPAIYSFNVEFTGTIGIPPNIADLQAAIEQIKPAHLAVTYSYLYTQWGKVDTITWGQVKAGTWGDLMNGRTI